MEKKQTAVHWLIEQTEKQEFYTMKREWYFEQAIAMEREQHRQTWGKGVEFGEANCEFIGETRLPKFEQYYTQNFKP